MIATDNHFEAIPNNSRETSLRNFGPLFGSVWIAHYLK